MQLKKKKKERRRRRRYFALADDRHKFEVLAQVESNNK